MSGPPPNWHSEAKALRASGIEPHVIAVRLSKTITMVRWVLDENGERQAVRDGVRQARLHARQSPRRKTDKIAQHNVKPGQSRVNRDTISQAVRDFSDHKIDRATLMARITPERRT